VDPRIRLDMYRSVFYRWCGGLPFVKT
jgi:hypothetical protein